MFSLIFHLFVFILTFLFFHEYLWIFWNINVYLFIFKSSYSNRLDIRISLFDYIYRLPTKIIQKSQLLNSMWVLKEVNNNFKSYTRISRCMYFCKLRERYSIFTLNFFFQYLYSKIHPWYMYSKFFLLFVYFNFLLFISTGISF